MKEVYWLGKINDSEVFYDESRLLAQHQAALTIIQAILDNPELHAFKWLDLACGKGQIITQLEKNLSLEAITKIQYYGYDIQSDFLKITEKKAKSLKMNSVDVKTGEISSFPSLFPEDLKFDFVTLTNTIHEFSPKIIPQLLYEIIIRLNNEGAFFIYDMEKLPSLELGAIPWKKDEITDIILCFLRDLGIDENYNPRAGQWVHKSCNGWNINLQRKFFGIDLQGIKSNKKIAIENAEKNVREKLKYKFEECKEVLDSITEYGVENHDEENEKIVSLYDFWALHKALEVKEI